MATIAELLKLIERFLCGDDISIAAANAIEVAVDDMFTSDQQMQDLVLMLASYRPGGGEYLFSEEEIRVELRKVLDRLRGGNLASSS